MSLAERFLLDFYAHFAGEVRLGERNCLVQGHAANKPGIGNQSEGLLSQDPPAPLMASCG